MLKMDRVERKKRNIIKKQLKQDLILKYGLHCYYCDGDFPENKLTLDHVVPVKTLVPNVRNRLERKIARRASYVEGDTSNLVLACGPCNVKKGDSNVTREVFRRRILKNEKGVVFKDEICEGVRSIVYPDNPIISN